MHHNVAMIFAEIIEESKDKGPHKNIRVQADGKQFSAAVLEQTGFASGPRKGGMVMLMVPDGDFGKAVAFPMAKPGERIDGQKAGELMAKNFTTGTLIQMTDNGNIEFKVMGDANFDITGDAVIKTSGDCHLGGKGGPAVARIGDTTSDGAIIQTGSSKVYAVD